MGDSTLIALLGEIALRRDGALAAVPGARARLLVAALAVHPGRSRSAQALIDDVWGEDPPRAPMNALHTQVSRLRSALPEGVLEIGPAGYRLMLTPEQVDLSLAHQLERQARQAHTAGHHAACLDLLAAARALWRGEPAADLPPGPVAEELATLAAGRRRALDVLELAAREAAGDLPAAIDLAQQAVAADPFDEPAHGTLMRLLAAAGRTNEALDVFATLRTRLVDQLGADPGPALVALNTAILRGEPLPGAPAGRDATGPSKALARLDTPAAAGGGGSANGMTGHGYPSGTISGSGPLDGGHAVDTVANSPGAVRAQRDPSAFDLAQEPVTAGQVHSLRRVLSAQHAAEARDQLGEKAIGLRVAPNPLLGRESDLEQLEQLVRISRVTTVLGPGGTGKTRVANELGTRLAHDTAVALVELASLRADPEGAADTRAEIEVAIAATLGVTDVGRETNVLRQQRGRDIGQRLREALAVRPTLLILDNCEHLIEPVAEVVADLVGASDQLTVLTTSRAPLEITAEAVYPLPPLTIDPAGSPATELFEARARSVRPSVRLDPEVVARLCRTLDGLPLAIELAAARVRTMSVEEIDARLDHRFALLRSGDRSSPQRHRTLYAVIEWSWNLLDGPQRVALRRLCRFPAGFTLAAAEIVLAGPDSGTAAADIDDAATAVDGLVSQSLLTVLEDEQGGTRYRMLETVREFGEEQLTVHGEADLVMDRMSEWARQFARQIVAGSQLPEQVSTVLALSAEQDNLVAVLRRAVDRRDPALVHTVFPILAGLWALRGAHMELVSWSGRIMSVPPRGRPAVTAETDLQLYGHLMLGLHMMFGGRLVRDAIRIRHWIRRTLHSGAPMSPLLRFLGELVTVPRNTIGLGRMLAYGARSADSRIQVMALLLRANMLENDGRVYPSIRDADNALRINGDHSRWETVMICQHLGSMHGQSGRYDVAARYYRRAVELMEEFRAWDESVEIRGYLAVALAGVGEPAAARRELEPVLGGHGGIPAADAPVTQPNHRLAAGAAALAEVELAEGDTETALRRFRQVPALLNWPGSASVPGPGDLILVSVTIDAHVLHGRADQVRRLVSELTEVAVRKLSQFFDLPQIGAVGCAVGTYLLATGQNIDRGLELVALTPKAFGRQDYPSMRWQRHYDLHRPVVGDERADAALKSVAGLGRRAAAQRILDHLRALEGTS
ncbi:winged helix-turn-helix domain-containing protein [Nocardia tengchongensis]|uniref:Winged helix-turn-helix domain-containing protein n=1 Tax=Nocardia tengchongensis TaxID=2055889 RepID=A0ABX8CVA3_9NOCA|nr:BTAD domain-containing putative transcriptional regulator [Nocardia tengchongensis]QVI23093.1 winged helix-turn-helix domain-containing protein [Nocardia tengchongensis]